MRIFFLLVLIVSTGFAGSATIFNGAQSNGSASGSGFVSFNSYNASSITISVQASAYGGSQQGGGRNYSAAAEAVIGPFRDANAEPHGGDPLSIGASLSITVTKHNDGNWYAGGTNLGGGVSISSSAYVDGENAVGFASAWGIINWTDAPANLAPTISWVSAPSSVASGQSYNVTAHGHDADGNLTQVNVWRDGVGYAFAGGGNGYDGNSGNASTDTGPRTVTYTANAIDSNGAPSPTISCTVTITAPPPVNRSPTISWISSPGSVGSGQSYTVTAHGRDPDGNLTQVNVWKSGTGFAFAGGGNGYDGDSGNGTSDTGPQTITYTANAVDSNGAASPTISYTVTIAAPAPVNRAPTISWLSTPGSVASGQNYQVTARGHDPDGNLTQVNVWRDGVGYAFAGGGNGYDGDSGNSSSDTGPRTVTYTANAVDSNGATSPTISQTVSIGSGNRSPTVAWNLTPGTVTDGQSYTISAHGHDADGNLTEVNVWKNGAAFARAGGGNGFDFDSGNTTSDAGPGTVTFTAQTADSNGATSATISQTITVTAAPPVGATLAITPNAAAAPASATLSWTTSNATSVAITGPGVSNTAASGSQTLTGLAAGSYTYTLVAQGPGGPVTRTASVVVTVPPVAVSGAIGASPASGIEPLSTTISWRAADATSVSVSGPGLGSTAGAGSQATPPLPAGTYVYTLTAQGYGGPITRSVSVTVAPVPVFALTTAASGGGSVTPGGSYPAGSVVTIAANADPTHRFTGWTGDAAGLASSIAITVDRAKFAQANFAAKSPQTIAFAAVGDRAAASPAFMLDATASSGLPVTFSLLSGPANLSGGALQPNGPGMITVQASQLGDAYFLPATPVTQTFNATSVPLLRYQSGGRLLLDSPNSRHLAPFVIEKP